MKWISLTVCRLSGHPWQLPVIHFYGTSCYPFVYYEFSYVARGLVVVLYHTVLGTNQERDNTNLSYSPARVVEPIQHIICFLPSDPAQFLFCSVTAGASVRGERERLRESARETCIVNHAVQASLKMNSCATCDWNAMGTTPSDARRARPQATRDWKKRGTDTTSSERRATGRNTRRI